MKKLTDSDKAKQFLSEWVATNQDKMVSPKYVYNYWTDGTQARHWKLVEKIFSGASDISIRLFEIRHGMQKIKNPDKVYDMPGRYAEIVQNKDGTIESINWVGDNLETRIQKLLDGRQI